MRTMKGNERKRKKNPEGGMEGGKLIVAPLDSPSISVAKTSLDSNNVLLQEWGDKRASWLITVAVTKTEQLLL